MLACEDQGVSRITIRRAVPEDLAAILAMYAELADPSEDGPAAGETAAKLLREVIADSDRHLTAALLDGKPAGTADLLLVANLTHHGSPWAILENVVVAASARRAGVGTKLMSHLIELAREA